MTLVIILGGAGVSQMGDVAAALRALATSVAPGVLAVWTPPEGTQNQQRVNVWPAIAANPMARVILIGHSLAAKTVIDAAAAMAVNRAAALAAMAEDTADMPEQAAELSARWPLASYVAVIEDVWGSDVEPQCGVFDSFKGDFLIDFPPASIAGVVPIVIPGTGHNSICHDPRLINALVTRVKAVIEGGLS